MATHEAIVELLSVGDGESVSSTEDDIFPKGRAKAKTKANTKAKKTPKAHTKANTKAKTKAKATAKTKAKSATQTKAKAQPSAKKTPKPTPKPKPKPSTDTKEWKKPKPNTGAKAGKMQLANWRQRPTELVRDPIEQVDGEEAADTATAAKTQPIDDEDDDDNGGSQATLEMNAADINDTLAKIGAQSVE